MKRLFVSLSLTVLWGGALVAQPLTTDTTRRIPTTPLAFLNFTPDARSAALGDAGVALSPDANATFWNPAKLPYAEKDYGVALSYTPWLRNLVDDMFLTYLTGYKKIGSGQVVAFSLNYFNNGEIDLRNNQGINIGYFVAQELAAAGTYSRQLSQNFSMGLTLKYIYSNLAGNAVVSGFSVKPATTAAGDISAYYKKEFANLESGSNLTWSWGAMISNLGGKVSYGSEDRYFIPTNFKIGTGVSYTADGRNRFNFILDANKLMVPTPPVWRYQGGQYVAVRGRDPKELPLMTGIFGSFADAPDGFSEELKEVSLSTGVEYWYNDTFAARFGYFGESRMKGDRKFFTAGFGARFQERYALDFAYLMPVRQGSPLAQTLRLSLSMTMNKKSRAELDDLDQ